ncbi:TPA: hypothetical protein N0F65_008400 [Lagenidium giganteum]|uniref:Thioredoxin domain-containing protein n=1 Tax=Lagenidium giganteum TaxID=4803 RepID=A0AAV2YVZ4_9STRA|nr:TPA: hypothetical protein N0F65_008400 [Lagenidium giganteum]
MRGLRCDKSHNVRLERQQSQTAMDATGSVAAAASPLATGAAWKRFLAPYYILNTIALLVYVPIRYYYADSKELLERDSFLNIPREQEIFLLVSASIVINYRKKATVDGVVSVFFLNGKAGIIALLYYLDKRVCGWYFVYCAILFVAVGQPKYNGPHQLNPLNPASFDRLIKRVTAKTDVSWVVYFYADWSDHCLQHDAMVADLSLKYTSKSLQFGMVDVNKFPELARDFDIAVTSASWQLPTVIVFQKGKEVIRLPKVKEDGNVVKTILDRTGVTIVLQLEELSQGKKGNFPTAGRWAAHSAMGDSLGECCSGSALFIFNGVDLICGIVLTVYSLYLGVNGYAPLWLYAPILGVGGLLVLASLMSWCGAAHTSCSLCLSISSGLLVLLSLAEVTLAIVILTQGAAINKFLRDHQAELKLTDKQLRQFEKNKFFPAYVLLGLFAMELLRFCCSSELQRVRERQKFRYRKLSALRDLEDNLITVKKEHEISSKYADLREKYKNKYTAPDLTKATPSERQQLFV